MSRKKNIAIYIVFFLFIVGFIVFSIYRPDKQTDNSFVFTSIPFVDINQFTPTNINYLSYNYIGFNLAYNEKAEQALWVAYLSTKNQINNPVCKRNNYFKKDKSIVTNSALPNDYYKSGYDRGHLAPAGDMLWNEEAMKESFLMSNMSPQNPSFNRGAWKKLESRVRVFTTLEDSVIVITGPLFLDSIGVIGENNIVIPSHFYKIIVDISSPDLGSIAFVLPNRNTHLGLDKFAISIDSLENITNLDFMHSLPDDLQNQLEGTIDDYILKQIIE